MARIKGITPENATSEVKSMYDGLQKKLGWIPNMFLPMGNSPAVMKGYFALDAAAKEMTLGPMLREQIALVVSQANNCNYCRTAHTSLGKTAGLADSDIALALKGEAQMPKDTAILKFAKSIIEKRGQVSSEEVEKLQAAGVSDQEIVEVIMVSVVTIFTNYLNHIVDPEVDFPKK